MIRLKVDTTVGGIIMRAGAAIDPKRLTAEQLRDVQALAHAGHVEEYDPDAARLTRDDSAAANAATPAQQREMDHKEGVPDEEPAARSGRGRGRGRGRDDKDEDE